MRSMFKRPPGSGLTPSARSWNLLILLWLIPVLGLSLAAYLIASRAVHGLIVSNNRSAATTAQKMLQRYVDHNIRFVEASAAQPGFVNAVARRDKLAIREYLKTMTRMSDQIENAQVCSTDCLILAASGKPPGREGSHIDRRAPSYLTVMENRKSCVSAAHLMRRGSQQLMVISIASPIFAPPASHPYPDTDDPADKGGGRDKASGELIGILLCQVPLEELATYVNTFTVGGDGHVLVIDHFGRLVAHPNLNFTDDPFMEYAKLEQFAAARGGQESMVEYDDPLAGKRMAALFVPARIAGHDWVIVAQQPAAEAYAPIRRMAFQIGLAVAITVAMCLFAVFHVRRMGQSLQQEQESLKRLLDVYEQQRQLLAFEIHDCLAQQLVAALMTFESLSSSSNGSGLQPQFAGGLKLLRECLAESRRLMSGMRPPILDDFGVVPALKALVEEHCSQSGVPIDAAYEVQFDRLAPPLEIAIYRIVQEGLTNCVRHSGTDRVRINLMQQGDRVQVEVEDWGRGFDPQTAGQGRFGLLGIRERARLLGGRAEIDAEVDRGTRIVVDLPVILRFNEPDAAEDLSLVE